jgi:bacterial surface protein 26-residue repeat
MFNGLSSVETLNLGDRFDVYAVTDEEDIRVLFKDFNNLKELNLGSAFRTDRVTDMSYMFSRLSNLESLNLGSKFDTSRVTDMAYMFSGMSSLKNLELGPNFNTSYVTNMNSMFRNMSSLKSLYLDPSFKTPRVTNMSTMFAGMSSLESLSIINLTTNDSPYGMFEGDEKLSKLALGPKISLTGKNGNVKLPAIIDKNATGNWINVGSGTIEKPAGTNIWTSDQFMKNYDGQKHADTYIWQKKDMEVKAQKW